MREALHHLTVAELVAHQEELPKIIRVIQTFLGELAMQQVMADAETVFKFETIRQLMGILLMSLKSPGVNFAPGWLDLDLSTLLDDRNQRIIAQLLGAPEPVGSIVKVPPKVVASPRKTKNTPRSRQSRHLKVDVLPTIKKKPTTHPPTSETESLDLLPPDEEVIDWDLEESFMQGLGMHSLLTLADEVELSERIKLGKEAAEYLTQNPDLVVEAKADLEKHVLDGQLARDEFVIHNQRLVMSVAKHYQRRGMPYEDLFQEGNLGLLRAVNKYDSSRGFRFSTYAYWWIRQGVTRALSGKSREIRLPINIVDELNRIYRQTEKLTQNLGREANIDEIADFMEMPRAELEELFDYARHPISLNEPVGEDGESEIGDFIEDQQDNDTVDEETIAANVKILQAQLKFLSPREKHIVKLRFGFYDGREWTLAEIGEVIGLTRERIRQLEKDILRKMRHNSALVAMRQDL